MTIGTYSGGRQRTLADSLIQLGCAVVLAVRAGTWLRDEEANTIGEYRVGGSLAEVPRDLRVNFVQQNVQQQGRTTTGMHDRRQLLQAAEVSRSLCAPVVRIEVVNQSRRGSPTACHMRAMTSGVLRS